MLFRIARRPGRSGRFEAEFVPGDSSICPVRYLPMRYDHLVSAAQLSRDDIEAVLDRAAEMADDPDALGERHAGTVLGSKKQSASTRPACRSA